MDTLEALIAGLIPREIAPNPRATALVVQIAAIEVAGERAGLRPRSGPMIPDGDVKLALREMIHRYLFGGAVAKTKPRRAGVGARPRRR